MLKNILSIDLEDYFCDLPFELWANYKERVVKNTKIILRHLDSYKAQATFFTLGYIAEKHPELIEEIIAKGHEISSHGYYHKDLRKISPSEFEKELSDSIKILEKISGDKVLGFRAPFFSISKNNFHMLEIIKKYLKYDSSIFPVKTSLYGIPDAPRYIYLMSNKNPLTEDKDSNFTEIPLATLKIPLIGNIPIAGGFYLRFLPNSLIKIGIKKMNKDGHPAMCYIHPKDIDPNMPKIPQYDWHYYYGLNSAEKKFESLLKNFNFSSVREIVLE